MVRQRQPERDASHKRQTADVLIVGAGLVGLSAGLALAQSGLGVIIVGKIETGRSARTVALLDGSVCLLKALGVWPRCLPHAAPLATMRIIDDTDSLFRAPAATFDAAEIGLEAFGWNIENIDLVRALAEAAHTQPGLTLIDGLVASFDIRPAHVIATCPNGTWIEARLIIAADGRESAARKAAQIPVRQWGYPQAALTAILAHTRSHANTSTEFHTRQGPFTLVPLPGRPNAPMRSSLVWLVEPGEAKRRSTLDDAALALEIERQARSILGKFTLEASRGCFLMTGMSAGRIVARRLALVGEAAHVFPPIGAQGLNLGLRDVAHLVDCIEDRTGDPGGDGVLVAYAARRAGDIAMRTAAIDMLNRSLLAAILPVDFLRGAGLIALSSVGPLRRALMRAGVMPRAPAPRLMRAQGRV